MTTSTAGSHTGSGKMRRSTLAGVKDGIAFSMRWRPPAALEIAANPRLLRLSNEQFLMGLSGFSISAGFLNEYCTDLMFEGFLASRFFNVSVFREQPPAKLPLKCHH